MISEFDKIKDQLESNSMRLASSIADVQDAIAGLVSHWTRPKTRFSITHLVETKGARLMPLDGKAVRAGVLESLERINLGPKRSKFGVTMASTGPDLPNQKYELIDNTIVDGRCEIYEADQTSVDHVVVANRPAELFLPFMVNC